MKIVDNYRHSANKEERLVAITSLQTAFNTSDLSNSEFTIIVQEMMRLPGAVITQEEEDLVCLNT